MTVFESWLGNPNPRADDTDRVRELRHLTSRWSGLRTLVTGIGISGFAAADALLEVGAEVAVVDSATGETQQEKARLLEVLGATVLLGPEHVVTPPQPWDAYDLVVTSPGWHPDAELLVGAARAGVPVWGDVELAWRMRPETGAAPWLTLTGTNGKTTVVEMAAEMLRAAGLRATSAGNVGTPLVEALRHPHGFEFLAVELSSYQLHWLSTDVENSVRPLAAAVLNVAPDHLDWHGSMGAYTLAKGRIYQNTEVACVYNVADPVTEDLVREADVVEGARAIGFTRAVPGLSMLGLVEDVLCDRAFVEQRRDNAAELCSLADLRPEGSSEPVPRTRSRTSSPPLRWSGRRASRRSPCATVSGRSALRRTGSRPSRRRTPRRVRSAGSTIPRPPTPTPRTPRWGRSRASSGSPAGTPRAGPSTTW